jgi:hypothetical protein
VSAPHDFARCVASLYYVIYMYIYIYIPHDFMQTAAEQHSPPARVWSPSALRHDAQETASALQLLEFRIIGSAD